MILDLVLPDGRGSALVPLIRELMPAAQLVLISSFLTAHDAMDMQLAGVPVIPKPVPLQLLLRRSVGNDPRLQQFSRAMALSPREHAVLEGGVAGLSNKELATKLGLSEGTIITYWQRIYHKTGCRSQKEVFVKLFSWRTRTARED